MKNITNSLTYICAKICWGTMQKKHANRQQQNNDYVKFLSKKDVDLLSYLNEIAKVVGYTVVNNKYYTLKKLYQKNFSIGQAIEKIKNL